MASNIDALLQPPRSTGDKERDNKSTQNWLWDFYRIGIIERALAGTNDTTAEINAAVQAAFDELQANISVILPTPYTIGDLLYASSATDLSKLSAVAVNSALISSGVGVAPAWGKIGLTTHVNGTLAVGNGGTGITTGTSGGVLGYTGTTTLASSGLLTANALMLGGGSGALPSTPLGLGTTAQVLHGNAGGAPTWGAVALAADVSGQLPLANGGTAANLTASNGGIFYSTGSAGAILAGTATAGQMLRSGSGAAPTWSTTTYPATATANQVMYATASNVLGGSASLTFDGTTLSATEMKFGIYTAGAIVQTGSVSITDAGGTTRRLLVG